ncbi:DUF992 domain-containing protein [Sinisalibacter aestuarii]|uniref:DUF992 domain-containing protein n=1 Tax=Sinisalibacter aestuarii TaxID=2949426 RepID=A0ABQ5LQD3_9RHOB|nr:DUF992 domain-containing protein [Sinisalibacter aestuarii]GKY87196.1 hypothetical protein STA1M1_10650 [Sinisalibacter aestuarii]
MTTANLDPDRPRTRRAAGLAALLALSLAAGAAEAQNGVKAGTLTCLGEGGWGAIVTSKKVFECTYVSVDGNVKEAYQGTIRKVGIDIGMTDKSALAWLVLGPETGFTGDYLPGALAGEYRGVGAEATLGTGVGANLLFGEGDEAFRLQPVSVQMQTGLSIAAGVQTMSLDFVGVVTN